MQMWPNLKRDDYQEQPGDDLTRQGFKAAIMAVFNEIKENMSTVNKKIKKTQCIKIIQRNKMEFLRPENYSIWKVHIASKW